MESNVFIYGAPGAGKTTFSIKLEAELKYPLVEADYLREVIAQREKVTEDQDPFVFVGTKQAWRKIGDLTPENVIAGLRAVRKSMAPYVSREIAKYSTNVILEASFLDPKEIQELGKLILVVAPDEQQHCKQYFEHREESTEQNENFQAVRIIQDFLIQEAKKYPVTTVQNDENFLSKAASLKLTLNL